MHFIWGNKPAYELTYALIYYFIPYWVTKSVIKYNITSEFNNLWRYWIHLFIAAGKQHYSVLLIRFLWIQRALNLQVQDIFDSNWIFSFSGKPGSGMPIDGFNEMVNTQILLNYVLCMCTYLFKDKLVCETHEWVFSNNVKNFLDYCDFESLFEDTTKHQRPSNFIWIMRKHLFKGYCSWFRSNLQFSCFKIGTFCSFDFEKGLALEFLVSPRNWG